MNAYTQKAELDQSSENLFLQFFNERILSLSTISSKNMYLSKQLEVKRLRSEVLRFIKEHSYSYFELTVLGKQYDLDLNKPLTGILIKNFEIFKQGDWSQAAPRRYMIAIHPTWVEARYFQLSSTGVRIEELLS